MRQSDLVTLTRVLRDDLAPRTATESVVLSDRPHARLLRYGTADQLGAAREAGAVPVLLVPPLAVPASCYDLAPGNSVVEFLLASGTIPYVIDFGDVGRAERGLGFEDYFDTMIPRAIGEVVDDFRGPGDALDLMAWSLGGTLSFLTAAHDRSLPIRSVISVGTPLDYMQIPPYPLVRQLLGPTGGRPATYALRAMAGIPAPIVRTVYRGFAWQRELTKPWYILANLGDTGQLQVLLNTTIFPPPCAPGDLDCNGTIDGADLGSLLGAWGSSSPTADLNGDGTVDGADLGLLLSMWG